jgi:hypothetical protein
MIVNIRLVNGTCSTLFSTIQDLVNIPECDFNTDTIYLGRSKEAFCNILRHLRGETIKQQQPIEDYIIFGLSPDKDIGRIINFNVGGTIFMAREKVLNTMTYFKSFIDWNQNHESFIDRDPDDFATFLHIVESHFHGDFTQMVDSRQAEFFGFETKPTPKIELPLHIQPLQTTTHLGGGLYSLVSCTGPENNYIHESDFLESSVFLTQPKRSSVCSFQYTTLVLEKHAPNTYKISIPRNCDLIGNFYIHVDFETMPTCVYDMFSMISLKFMDQVLDSYSGDAMRVFANLREFKIEIQGTRAVIPLALYFQNKPHLFIPIVALGHENNIELIVELKQNAVANIALMFQSIYLDSDERRYFAQNRLERVIYTTAEHTKLGMIVDSSNLIHRFKLQKSSFKHIVKDLFIHLKPREDLAFSSEPLNSIKLKFKTFQFLEYDAILSRRITPREVYGIDNNQEFIYYIHVDNAINLSRLDKLYVELDFAIEGIYDVVVVAKVSNVMRVSSSMMGLAFCR